jgi:dienelactone hydrolase
MNRATRRRQGKRLVAWVVAAAIVVVAVGVGYFGTPLHGTTASIASVETDTDVTVSQTRGTYRIDPAGNDPVAGLVFYPGGRVHPDAYLASLAPLAARADVTVAVPKMPLNLAVLGQGTASRYVSGSDVDTWYVGGHSLGGVMACRYARTNPAAIAGVILFASYCDRDISATGLAVLRITGTADTVLDREAVESTRANLPAGATVRELPLNHSQFGAYRGQSGDGPSGLGYDSAHDRLAEVVLSWLREQ